MQLWQSIGGGRCFGGDEYERRRKAEASGQSHTDALAKLSWLLSRESTWATPQPQQQQEFMLKAAMGAASSGSMPVLQWLLDKDMDVCGSRRAVRVLANALLEQHVDVADWLVEVASCPLPLPQLPRELEDACFSAGRSGSMQPIRWLLGRGVPVHAAAVLGAARSGHLEAVQFLHAEQGLPLTTELFSHAVESGSMPTVQWLLQAGCPMGPKAYRCAAEAGDVAMVLWQAQEAGCPWNAGTVSSVVDHWPRGAEGSARLLPTVRALVEAGCPPDGVQGQGPAALDVALCHGHLPLARYLHEECGVGFGPETLAAAAGGGCEPVLEWLVGAGCVPGAGYPYSKAADHGDLATLRCLRRLGVPLGDAGWWKKVNVYKVPLAAVRWLVEHGAPWDEGGARAISARARFDPRLGNEESLEWLHARIAEDAWAVQQAAEGWGRE